MLIFREIPDSPATTLDQSDQIAIGFHDVFDEPVFQIINQGGQIDTFRGHLTQLGNLFRKLPMLSAMSFGMHAIRGGHERLLGTEVKHHIGPEPGQYLFDSLLSLAGIVGKFKRINEFDQLLMLQVDLAQAGYKSIGPDKRHNAMIWPS